jgi:hypothetical protein
MLTVGRQTVATRSPASKSAGFVIDAAGVATGHRAAGADDAPELGQCLERRLARISVAHHDHQVTLLSRDRHGVIYAQK